MKTIGFLGAWSIDNAGDQLLGYAVRQAFRARLPGCAQVALAPEFRGNMWRHCWDRDRGIDATIRRIPPGDGVAWAKGLDAVVIGGGELLRLEPDFRPFLLGEAADWDPGIPAAWNSVGAEKTPSDVVAHRPVYRAVLRCCETLAYASVRNETTARFVRSCGFTGPLPIVPDPTMLLTLPPGSEGRGEAILDAAGLDRGRFVVGVSVGTTVRDPRASGFYAELFAALRSRSNTAEMILFPFGDVYGDPDLQRLAQRALPNARLAPPGLSATDRWRLIGALDLCVCTRYHAMLAAFAEDVPFVVIDEYFGEPTRASKIRDFVCATGLDTAYLRPGATEDLVRKLDEAFERAAAGAVTFEAARATQRSSLQAHYDRMIRALGLAPIRT